MKKFLFIVLIFFLPILLVVLVTFNADGHTDPFYLRFTSPQQTSLIVGTSRAAQGIMPSVLNAELNRKDIYNYAFTVVHSPFGEAYFNSIKRKVAETTKNGIFIIAVDPWSLSSSSMNPDDSTKFQEWNLAVGRTRFVTLNPNIPYLVTFYDKPLINLFGRQVNGDILVHDDGWLEVSVSMDSATVSERIRLKQLEYKKNYLPVLKPSNVRIRWLIKTISYLKEHGTVYMVRLPVHKKIFALDSTLMPDFERKVKVISQNNNIPFLDMMIYNDSCQYTDGNHLYKQSSRVVSEKVARWIKQFIH